MAKIVKPTPRNKKLSEIVAAKLMEDIRDRGWPVGESLGTEAELMARFKVSRATIAEAARHVERHGAAIMRRGSGGGLVIINSASSALSRSISSYLEITNVSMTEQYEATLLIETEAAKLACENISEEQLTELRAITTNVATSEDNLSLHRSAMQLRIAIAEASGSDPILLFMRSLARVLTHYVRPDLRTPYRDRGFEHGVAADLSGVSEAIVAGNSSLAAHYVRMDIERREQRAHELAIAQPLLESGPLRRETSNKLAEKVAYNIRDDIARSGWQVGEKLGDETDLPKRYGVSQWVLRQAVRILEPSGIVRMRRGQGGGLYIGTPSPEQTIETTVSYLNSYIVGKELTINDYIKIRHSIYQCIAQFSANRGTLKEREQLLLLTIESSPNSDQASNSDEFLKLLSVMARNQILELFGEILNKFISENSNKTLKMNNLSMAVAEAVHAGDAPLAQRRMGAYLDSLH